MEGDDEVSASVMRFFRVRGKVQNVMFRQTVIRAMIKRGLEGGATNDKADKTLVHMTLVGDNHIVQELVDAIASGKALNDWGAKATEVKEVEETHGKQLAKHQVTTGNVHARNWNPNCTMYL
ncbi:hypothetical protein Poli38472_001496 [Pythium oligandrum]|uniref:acylphosphatase n=1 Tax=Pythium oligandrum TaxID=41045 RepID=A0A8K1CTK1_PYTOL|nr:hypothetical protein Poli38472_001496 [Pythium oligandrum]|eukprot:TMW69340.1 hypothetical protein Poli38472_001496 [Pythium oligandrum]